MNVHGTRKATCNATRYTILFQVMQRFFAQFVGDNINHDLNTIDGETTHRGLGSMVIVNGGSFNESSNIEPIPRAKNES